MRTLWIIKAGTTFPDTARRHGDFEQWTLDSLGWDRHGAAIWDARLGQPLPAPSQCAGVVVTGSHAMVTDALPWSVRLEKWIPEVVEREIPFLGICYGHQLLARAMGGRVDYHPRGREIGTVRIELLAAANTDPIFSGLSGQPLVHVVHSQTVLQLPPAAERLARNDFEPNHAFRIGPAAWGIQFHPEYNRRIMCAYIEELSHELRATDHDVAALLKSVRDAPEGRDVLLRFADHVRQQPGR